MTQLPANVRSLKGMQALRRKRKEALGTALHEDSVTAPEGQVTAPDQEETRDRAALSLVEAAEQADGQPTDVAGALERAGLTPEQWLQAADPSLLGKLMNRAIQLQLMPHIPEMVTTLRKAALGGNTNVLLGLINKLETLAKAGTSMDSEVQRLQKGGTEAQQGALRDLGERFLRLSEKIEPTEQLVDLQVKVRRRLHRPVVDTSQPIDARELIESDDTPDAG